MRTNVMILLVMTRERRSLLLHHLASFSTEVLAVCDTKEALRILSTGLPIEVVITDFVLPDGNWRSVVDGAARTRAGSDVVVCIPAGLPAGWRETMNGDWEVLAEPYHRTQVERLVEGALARRRPRLRAA